MRHQKGLRLLGTTVFAFVLLNQLGIHLPQPGSLNWHGQGDRVEAAKSGGRSGGGSFSRGSSSRSSSRSSSPTRSRTAPSNSNSNSSSFRTTPSNSVVIVNSHSNGTTSSLGSLIFILICLTVLIVVAVLCYRLQKQTGSKEEERTNDIVTLTRLQVALMAQDGELQSQLNQTVLAADTSTSAGLVSLLQEAVLLLLRSPDRYSHVASHSETYKTRELASQQFQTVSLQERSKFSAETLVNVGGQTQQRKATVSGDEVGYFVMTLLIGTEDDQPLLSKIHTIAELKTVLEQLGTITEDNLLIFELLWTPQNEGERLTSDELLVGYPDLIQL